MSWRRRLTFLLLATALGAACAAGAPAATTKQVVLEDIEFKPARVTVRRGDRVRWVWRDVRTPHNVASRGRHRFRSSATKTTGTHVVRFRKRGAHLYVCTIHPGMAGKVTVR